MCWRCRSARSVACAPAAGRPARSAPAKPVAHRVGLGVDPRPVGLGVAGRPALRGLVGVGVAPALARLLGPLAAGLVGAEHFQLLLRCQVDPHRPRLQFLVDGRDQRGRLLFLRDEQLALPPQVGDRVRGRVADQLRDLAQAEAEPPVGQHLPQPLRVGRVVGPVAGGGAPGRGQQPDLVVVMQRPHGDPGQFGQLPHGQVIIHVPDYAPSRHVRVKAIARALAPLECQTLALSSG